LCYSLHLSLSFLLSVVFHLLFAEIVLSLSTLLPPR
jgi:hypothetical protein